MMHAREGGSGMGGIGCKVGRKRELRAFLKGSRLPSGERVPSGKSSTDLPSKGKIAMMQTISLRHIGIRIRMYMGRMDTLRREEIVPCPPSRRSSLFAASDQGH